MTKKLSKKDSITPESSEFWLVCSVTDFLVSQGYRVRLEVSNMGQSIDAVATRGRWITAIEAKRKNWRRALDQCRAHCLVADHIVVALAVKVVPPDLFRSLIANGWGLLIYDSSENKWRWEIRPKRNTRVWKPQRRRFVSSLRKVSYASRTLDDV
jgi:hypothetical protein